MWWNIEKRAYIFYRPDYALKSFFCEQFMYCEGFAMLGRRKKTLAI